MSAINLDLFTNRNEITADTFEDIKKSQRYEIFSQKSIQKFIEDTANTLEKGETDELSEGEQAKVEIAKAQILTLSPIVVVENIKAENFSDEIKKSVYYIREKIQEVSEAEVKF